jgi:hypothetical protein
MVVFQPNAPQAHLDAPFSLMLSLSAIHLVIADHPTADQCRQSHKSCTWCFYQQELDKSHLHKKSVFTTLLNLGWPEASQCTSWCMVLPNKSTQVTMQLELIWLGIVLISWSCRLAISSFNPFHVNQNVCFPLITSCALSTNIC